MSTMEHIFYKSEWPQMFQVLKDLKCISHSNNFKENLKMTPNIWKGLSTCDKCRKATANLVKLSPQASNVA